MGVGKGPVDDGNILASRRILIVEDHFLVADDIRRMLLSLGAEVVGPVGNVSAALDLVRGERLDAALLDIDLHGEMVMPVAAELRRMKVPCLFATGYGVESHPETFADVPRVEKPFTETAILAALEAIMKRDSG